jgi:hypothetical protein
MEPVVLTPPQKQRMLFDENEPALRPWSAPCLMRLNQDGTAAPKPLFTTEVGSPNGNEAFPTIIMGPS